MKSFLLTCPLLLASIKGCNQPKTKSFDDLTNKPPERKRKERKKRKEKGKPRENQREKEKEKREKGGEGHGSKGEGERECTAARERRGKAPRATTGSREPPSQPPSSVTR